MKKNWITWLVIAIVVVGAILLMRGTGGGGDVEGSQAPPVTDQDWIKGNTTSTVTLIEYSDFQCPACGAYYPILKQVFEEYGDRIQFVYRHFPLRNIHPNAEPAARAAEAAGKQGKFWEMHDMIFENQTTWSGFASVISTFEGYAQELGLDIEQFRQDLTDGAIADQVQGDYNGGLDAGVNSTPTFYLNGQKLDNPRGLEPFKQVIEEALAGN